MNLSEPSDVLYECPECGGPADNGHDRCWPPSPYFCKKCTAEVNTFRYSEEELRDSGNPFVTIADAQDIQASQTQVGGNWYSKLKIQPAEYAMANNLNYYQTLCLRYMTRYKDKNGIEDLEKAIHCLQLLKEYEYEHGQDSPGKD